MPPRQLLEQLFNATVAAADPFVATRDALTARLAARDDDGRGWLIAVGKAAAPMAHAAVDAMHATDLEFAGGIVVSPTDCALDGPIECLIGDHPVPGDRSRFAARRLGALTHAVLPKDHVILLVSGGTSSLIAAAVEGFAEHDLDALWHALLRAGAASDIRVMNALRRRVLRWGAGRLAAAMPGAVLHQVLLSDVIGDDPSVIGSGPAVPDPSTAASLLALIDRERIASVLPAAFLAHLAATVAGTIPETPKASDGCFVGASPPFVLGRTLLHDALRAEATRLDRDLVVHEAPLVGEAARVGAALADQLARAATGTLQCWTGETTVTLGDAPTGRGGRCQTLALAAAVALEQLGATGERVTLLAAGTDGRDGPTDAAGAVVDALTADAIRASGRDPVDALTQHNAYPALDAAHALLRTGPTGTNLADVVIAHVA